MRSRLFLGPPVASALLLVLALPPTAAHAATLKVGPGEPYTTIASAVAASQDGDTIEVQAGLYENDFAEIGTRIALIAVGGRVTMKATRDLPNDKGILITDTDVSIAGFTFAGAHIAAERGANGAGVRYQGGHLVLTGCFFHHNQDGLLADADPAGTIKIVDSEFAHNGDRSGPGLGYTHNLYVGAVASLDIEHGYFHHANYGHEIKSRAAITIVKNTRVLDGPTGTASYSIDLPNGGAATISHDQIEQGPDSGNGVMISYGEEGQIIAGSSLTILETLMENDLTTHAPLGVVNDTSVIGTLAAAETYGLSSGEVVAGKFGKLSYAMLSNEPLISTQHPF